MPQEGNAVERMKAYVDENREKDERLNRRKDGGRPAHDDIRGIAFYACPTPGCGNYFGHNDMGELEKAHTGPKTEDRHQISAEDSRVGEAGMRHSRAECPACRTKGIYVDRVRVYAIIIVPEGDPVQTVLPRT